MIQQHEKIPANTVIAEHGAGQSDHGRLIFTWHGCAHYHIRYKGKRIVIDPLYHRPRGDTPHLGLSRDDIDRIDYLLLTHAHLDHSWDFPIWLPGISHRHTCPKNTWLIFRKKRDTGGWV